jgi:hypothetical protein
MSLLNSFDEAWLEELCRAAKGRCSPDPAAVTPSVDHTPQGDMSVEQRLDAVSEVPLLGGVVSATDLMGWKRSPCQHPLHIADYQHRPVWSAAGLVHVERHALHDVAVSEHIVYPSQRNISIGPIGNWLAAWLRLLQLSASTPLSSFEQILYPTCTNSSCTHVHIC